jgi:hypothetical protein
MHGRFDGRIHALIRSDEVVFDWYPEAGGFFALTLVCRRKGSARSVTSGEPARPEFVTIPQYELNLQMIYDLKLARAEMTAESLRIEAFATG